MLFIPSGLKGEDGDLELRTREYLEAEMLAGRTSSVYANISKKI